MISGNATARYFDGNAYSGSRQIYVPSQDLGNGKFSKFTPNKVFFCTNCGKVWGRLVYEFSFDYSPFCNIPWIMHSTKCVPCGNGQFLEYELLESCDKDLLTRELLALLNGVKDE